MAAPINLWDQTLRQLRLEIDEENFATWLKPTRLQSVEGNQLHIDVPSAFNSSYLKRNFKDQIAQVVERVAERPLEVNFHVAPETDGAVDSVERRETSAATPRIEVGDSHLSPRYRFENFVVGECNRFAHAAGHAVAEPETETWNPLLLWGGVGLGKTHLLQAIGHEYLDRSPKARVCYVNSEQFLNSYIQALRRDRMGEFRDRYREVDLLLLDDVQFLFGKEATQREFFHTFNELYGNRKKIVLSSDRPPSEMANVEERLRSRFEWGLIVDVQAPDLETRVAILHQKARLEGFDLPNNVAIFIAERIKTNIRKLEGVLASLRHHWRTTGEPISLESTQKNLGHYMISGEPQRVSVEHIQGHICDYFGITLAELTGKERHRKLTYPRHIAMYLCRLLTELSFPDIARRFNGRNHTSILHAYRKIEKDLLHDTNLQSLTNYLAKKIQESSQ